MNSAFEKKGDVLQKICWTVAIECRLKSAATYVLKRVFFYYFACIEQFFFAVKKQNIQIQSFDDREEQMIANNVKRRNKRNMQEMCLYV